MMRYWNENLCHLECVNALLLLICKLILCLSALPLTRAEESTGFQVIIISWNLKISVFFLLLFKKKTTFILAFQIPTLIEI